jgi:hypothetical protein
MAASFASLFGQRRTARAGKAGKSRELARSKLPTNIIMVRCSSNSCVGAVAITGILALLATQTLCAGQANSSNDSTEQTKNPVRMNCGAQIECVTPDGRAGQVSRLPDQDPEATALIMDDDTVTCLLQEGETNFVIELPQTARLDRFTFLNENAVARGELRIAVSNQRLPAKSPEWTEVEGIVPFARKRLFGVSLLGIEAKFVRLSFHVEKHGQIDTRPAYTEKPAENSTAQQTGSAESAERFQDSGLEDALNSKFGMRHARGSTILLSYNSPSVGPLSPAPGD